MVDLKPWRSQLCFLKHNRAIPEVMERSSLKHGMAQRDFSAFVGGHDLIYPTCCFWSLYTGLVQQSPYTA